MIEHPRSPFRRIGVAMDMYLVASSIILGSCIRYRRRACLVIFGNILLQYSLRVILRLSRMYRQWLSQPHCMTQLTGKNLLLPVTRGIVVVVVQANLAPADTAWM